jgi:hypothetical protein
VRELPCHTSLVNKLVFSPDGKVLYTGSDADKASYFAYHSNGPLFVWDVDTGKRLKEMSAGLWDLSPDGKRLAIVENWIDIDSGFRIDDPKPKPSTFTLQVLDTTTWKELSRLHEKNAVMSTLRFSPDGKTLALSVPNYSIRLWDWQARKETLRFEATKLDEATTKMWAGVQDAAVVSAGQVRDEQAGGARGYDEPAVAAPGRRARSECAVSERKGRRHAAAGTCRRGAHGGGARTERCARRPRFTNAACQRRPTAICRGGEDCPGPDETSSRFNRSKISSPCFARPPAN